MRFVISSGGANEVDIRARLISTSGNILFVSAKLAYEHTSFLSRLYGLSITGIYNPLDAADAFPRGINTDSAMISLSNRSNERECAQEQLYFIIDSYAVVYTI